MSAPLRLIQDESPVECVVKALEDLLVQARKGDVRGLVMVFDTKGTIGHHIAFGKDASTSAIVGELDLAKFTVHVETGRIKPPR